MSSGLIDSLKAGRMVVLEGSGPTYQFIRGHYS